MQISKPTRHYLPENLEITNWSSIEKFYTELTSRSINSSDEFRVWLKDISELEAVLEEDAAWRYINMTIDTTNEEYSKSYSLFVSEIQPKIAPFENRLNQLLNDQSYKTEFEKDPAYSILFRRIKKSLDLYREENILLFSEVSEESQKFGSFSAAQTIEHKGEQLTMQKAASLLKETDENLRKDVFQKISNRRREDFDKFNTLFDTLLAKRHQIALNAGFDNFRDYKMEAMGRFDYSVHDCEAFHTSIKKVIVPLVKEIQQKRLDTFGKDLFKPWDLDVDPLGLQPLKPFSNGKELLEGTIDMFNSIDPYFGDCLQTMDKMKHLDLDSKNGKAPGGYNYPLYEIGVPFIFMNAVGSHRDLVTMVHEGGHAIHSFLSRDLELTGFKNLPSEVAELASMSMELLSMNQWGRFYPNVNDLSRAKKEQLETILKILPWVAQVDEFQHWLYVNHNHTQEERTKKWLKLCSDYGTGLVDWSGYDDILSTSWQRQLHIFEVPFYYIEYGISQLGALSVWKNSMENPNETINAYKEALKLAYTRSIPEIYETANIEFNFNVEYLQQLADFIALELKKLN